MTLLEELTPGAKELEKIESDGIFIEFTDFEDLKKSIEES
jgi:hypothetical protein